MRSRRAARAEIDSTLDEERPEKVRSGALNSSGAKKQLAFIKLHGTAFALNSKEPH